MPPCFSILLACIAEQTSYGLEYPFGQFGTAGSGWSILKPAGIGPVGHGGIFWQHLTEVTPVASHQQPNLATQTQYIQKSK